MKISQTAMFAGLTGLILAGLLAPTVYATEDGQFPVFPTVIEGESASTTDATTTGETVISPASPVKAQKTTVVKTETTADSTGRPQAVRKVERNDNLVINESGVFSPWGTVKQGLFGRAQAAGEGVVLALVALDSKPTSRGDLRYQISYANATGETLRNVSIQVFLPKDFQYLDSDVRPDSKGNGTVVYDLGKVASGESGAIQLEVRAKKKKAKDVFLSATMSYEDIDGNAQVVNATASNAFNGKNGGGLSASILDGAGGFMLWLFVIVLIIALAFAVYQLVVLRGSSQPRG